MFLPLLVNKASCEGFMHGQLADESTRTLRCFFYSPDFFKGQINKKYNGAKIEIKLICLTD